MDTTLQTELLCGGCLVRPGDIIVADDDGVVVVPKDKSAAIAIAAHRVVEREQAILAALARGRTTCEIFGIPQAPAADPLSPVSSSDRA